MAKLWEEYGEPKVSYRKPLVVIPPLAVIMLVPFLLIAMVAILVIVVVDATSSSAVRSYDNTLCRPYARDLRYYYFKKSVQSLLFSGNPNTVYFCS